MNRASVISLHNGLARSDGALAHRDALAPGRVAVALGEGRGHLRRRTKARGLRDRARLVETEDDCLVERQDGVEQFQPAHQTRARAAPFEGRRLHGDTLDVLSEQRINRPQTPRLGQGERARSGEHHRREHDVEVQEARRDQARRAQQDERARDDHERAPRAESLQREPAAHARRRDEQQHDPNLRRHARRGTVVELEERRGRRKDAHAPSRHHQRRDGERQRHGDEG